MSDEISIPYVITCGDEGVQVNRGHRLSVVGAGFQVDGFSQIVKVLKKLFGSDLRIAASAENDWLKEKLELTDWDQVNASAQQHVEALADKEGLLYAGILPFADPRELKHDVKGHMVRPHNVHVANKLCFTLAGGEQTYNLGQYQISAEWVSAVDKALVKQTMQAQMDFYTKISGLKSLQIVFEEDGELGEKVATKNRRTLEGLGIKASS